jgi:hypothetical protein
MISSTAVMSDAILVRIQSCSQLDPKLKAIMINDVETVAAETSESETDESSEDPPPAVTTLGLARNAVAAAEQTRVELHEEADALHVSRRGASGIDEQARVRGQAMPVSLLIPTTPSCCYVAVHHDYADLLVRLNALLVAHGLHLTPRDRQVLMEPNIIAQVLWEVMQRHVHGTDRAGEQALFEERMAAMISQYHELHGGG